MTDDLDDSAPPTLSDADMSSQPAAPAPMTRRSLLGAVGAGLAVAVVMGGSLVPDRAAAADARGRGRRCNYRDNDWSVRPQDNVRVNCGISDNDSSDRVNHGKQCRYRDSDRGAGRYRDTIRVQCGLSDNDR